MKLLKQYISTLNKQLLFTSIFLGVLIGLGCGSAHTFNNNEVPVITVGPGLQPVISWTPTAAYELNVYEGTEDGDGFGAIWTVRVGNSYDNNLQSPVTYGVPPTGADVKEAPPLEAGKTYTVAIFRKDPLGSGDGFTNTRHRYVGTATFVATEN